MLSILINAYACSPGMGSEPGMAWNWCVNLAKHCELHIITEVEFRDKIEAVLPTLPQAKNMHFYYNPMPEKIRKMCWNQGDWRFYYYYKQWQKQTLKIAKTIVAKEHIDIVHQLNMIGFREPGYLWKLDRPFVWGPTNAKEGFPKAYLQGTPWKKQLFIYIKNSLNIIQLKSANRVKSAIKKADFVIAASSDSAAALKKYFACNAKLINESGCDVFEQKPLSPHKKQNEFNLLWVGRFIFSKQLDIALKTLSQIEGYPVKLHLVGGEPHEEAAYKAIAEKLGIANKCVWHGKIPHAQVQQLMQSCDLFFFTSIAEGTPHVVLEAIGNNLPVLCFNTCGHGDSINEKVGIKIELSTPQQSIAEFAEKINYLYDNPEVMIRMAENCHERQKELSWDRKVEQMIQLYNQIVKQSQL